MDFEEEVAMLVPWLRNLARRFCRDRMDMEDLVGDTLLKVLSNKDKYDGTKALKPWIRAIMQNTYITCYNRSQVVSFVSIEPFWNEDTGVMADEPIEYARSPTSDMAEMGDCVEAIRKTKAKSCCVDSLLRYIEGYSYEEIGKMYDIPIGTVRSRISTARALVRAELEV